MSNLTIRPPQASEIPRALRFFSGEDVKSGAQVLVAVKVRKKTQNEFAHDVKRVCVARE